ncbi:hypothetical protein GCM10027064_11080 [Microbacterium petrolearium]
MRLTPTRLMRRLRRDARGSALIPAIGIAMVTLVIAATLTAATMTSLSRTDDTRDVVTAGFAAEAGVAVAQHALAAGCTTATDANDTEPFYRAVILRTTASGEQAGCPAAGEPYRIVSTGYADARDFEARTGGRTVEARYAVEVKGPTLVPSGPAIYAYSGSAFGGSGKLVALGGTESHLPEVHVHEGDVTCDGGSQGDVSWVVNGNLTVAGGCGMTGRAFVSGSVSVSGGGAVIGADLVARDVTITGSGRVGGSIWVSDFANLENGSVGGNVVADDVTMKSMTISGSVWARDDLTTGWTGRIHTNAIVGDDLNFLGVGIGKDNGADGNVWVSGTANLDSSAKSSKSFIKGELRAAEIKGDAKNYPARYTVGPPSDVPPEPTHGPVPEVADWIDFPYDPELWSGFTEVEVAAPCGTPELRAAIAAGGGLPTLLDARDCPSGVNLGGGTDNVISLPADLAIYAKDFRLDGSAGFTASGDRRVWLINADETDDGRPTCGGETIAAGGSFTFTNVTTMMYSPCEVSVASGLSITGQIFAAGVSVAGDATLTYVPSGLPGVDLGDGTSTGPTATPPTLDSYRDTSESAERWF